MYSRLSLVIIISLLALCIMPAMADEVVSKYSYGTSELSTWYADLDLFYNTGISNATNITRIDIRGQGYDVNRASMPVCTGTWRKDGDDGLIIADGSMAWSTEARSSYYAPAVWNLTFTNWNVGVYNSSMKLVFRNDTTCSKYLLISYVAGSINGTGYYTDPKNQVQTGSGSTVTIYGVPAIPLGPPTASYSCNVPGSKMVGNPFGLVCTDNSTANPAVSSVVWQLTNPDSSVFTTSNASLVKTLTSDGWYGLDFTACNAQGCGYKNTTQLVNVTTGYAPATGISFWVHIYDPIKSAKIANSELIVRNTTYLPSYRDITSNSGSFLISSTASGSTEPITAGQFVNLTGIAAGYQTGNATVSIPYDGWEYNLNLVATSDVPTGANATIIVNVINSYTAEGIEGATLTISNNTIPYSSSKLSNAGGSATFSSIPAGTYQIAASKTGYQSSTTSWSATASVVTNAYIGILPIGATPVITGTAGNSLFDANGNPIVGYDANGNPVTAAPTQDTRTAAEKDAGMMDLLRNNGESLIMLFILFTIIYMLKGIGK